MALAEKVARFGEAVNALEQVPTTAGHLSTSEFDHTDAPAGDRTRVATHQMETAAAIKDGESLDIDLVAYEQTTSNSSGGDQETVNLSHNLLDSDNPQDVVVYEGGTRLSVDSYDVANNAVTVTPQNADSTLHIWYVSGDQARVEIRKTAPNGVYETLAEYDNGLLNRRDQSKEPLTFEADHPLQGVLPTDWRLDVYVDGPYQVVWGVDTDSDDEDEATPVNQLLSVPIRRAQASMPAFTEDVVRQVAGLR